MLQAQLVGVCEGHEDRVWDAAWSKDGERLVSVSGDRSIRVWRRQRGTNASTSLEESPEKAFMGSEVCLRDAHEKTVRHCAFHPRDACFACASFDGTVSVWDAVRGSGGACDWVVTATLEGHENEVKGVAWSRRGDYLATCGRDKTVWVWGVSGGTGEDREYDCLAVLRSHTQDVKCVWWGATEDVLFSASYDDTVRAWRAGADAEDEWVCCDTLEGHGSTVWGGACAPAAVAGPGAPADELVTCSDDATVMFWSRARGAPGARWTADQVVAGAFDGRPVYSVAWSDDDRVACGAGDNSLKVYARVRDGRRFDLVLDVEDAHAADVNAVAWCPVLEPDGSRLLATAGDDELVKIWKISKA